MPGLMDMLGLQPQDAVGQPTDFGNALASRGNAMIGMGMGLLSPYRAWAGESPYTNALQGWQTGAAQDARTAQQQQQMAMEKARLAMAREQMNREPEAIRQLRAAGVPQEKWADYLYPRADEWKPGSVSYREQEYPFQQNLRTGEYRWGPLGPPGSKIGAPAAAPGGVPYTGAGPMGTGTAGPAAPTTTGAATPPAAGMPPAPMAGLEDELPSVQKKLREQQLTDWQKTQQKDPAQEAAAKTNASNVLAALDTAEKQVLNKGGLLPTTGIIGGKLTQVYGPSADLSATLNTIAGNISLEKLTAMRQASTTGASGLGAVTEPEHRMLMNSIAALEQSQSQDQMLKNLARVRATFDWVINRTDKNQPPPFVMQATQPATAGGGGTAAPATGGRTFVRDPSGRIVPQ